MSRTTNTSSSGYTSADLAECPTCRTLSEEKERLHAKIGQYKEIIKVKEAEWRRYSEDLEDEHNVIIKKMQKSITQLNQEHRKEIQVRMDNERQLMMQTAELTGHFRSMREENAELHEELKKQKEIERQLKMQTAELTKEIQVRMDNERQLKMQTAELKEELEKRKETKRQLKMQTAELTNEIQVRMANEHQLKMQTVELKRKLEDIDENRMEAERELKRQTEKLKKILEEREMLKKQTASLRDENSKLRHALDHDPQAKLLYKLHEDLQVVRTGVKDISEEVRNVNKQISGPTSRSSELENENISLKFRQIAKDTELKQVKDQLAMTVLWQSKRKEEHRSLIEQVMREQQMTMRKEVLSLLKLQSQTDVPLLDTQVKDDEEKLLGQVEDLQKQMQEKTEDLNKVSTELTEMSQERDSMERELLDALSVERETVKDLQREVEQLKLQTENSSQKLTQSKECIKALENMLNNLVLWEKTTDIEQLWSGVDSVSVRKPIVPGPLAYETELEKFCWIPFGIQSFSVGQEGGLFPLQPQSKGLSEDHDVIMLEVPANAVNTAVCDKLCIRYGVIVCGPFDVPEGYQLGSMTVYIYFDDDHTVKPVLLHLPHWVGKDSESNLKCAIAPHRLEEGEEKYKFRFTEDGDFESTEGSCVITIDGHCSLFALIIKALQQKSNLRYYASRVEKVGDYGTTLDVVITQASQVWSEILNEDIARGTMHPAVLFTFNEGMIQGSMSSQEGKGWKAALNEHDMVHQRDVEHQSHGIVDAHDMLGAVQKRVYPPYISCQTTYSEEVRKTGEPVNVDLVIKGAKDCYAIQCAASFKRISS